MQNISVKDLARGKWRGILLGFGLDDKFLNGRHGPCPLCGGKDRYRWDNKDGSGSYICSQCGAGSGMDLLMQHKGWDFRTAAREVEAVLGKVRLDPKRRAGPTDEQIREAKRVLWKNSVPVTAGDPVDQYLTARGVGFADYVEDLRYSERCRVSDRLWLPAMVAVVRDVKGTPVTLHRTWLGGPKKADLEAPRKLMPGSIPEGSCVRLSGERAEIGIAEGIETALAVEKLFETPCWAALNASMMAKWEPPAFVRDVTIFADNDPKFAGQTAAFTLARRLASKGLQVNVRVPPVAGTDWNDVLLKEAA